MTRHRRPTRRWLWVAGVAVAATATGLSVAWLTVSEPSTRGASSSPTTTTSTSATSPTPAAPSDASAARSASPTRPTAHTSSGIPVVRSPSPSPPLLRPSVPAAIRPTTPAPTASGTSLTNSPKPDASKPSAKPKPTTTTNRIAEFTSELQLSLNDHRRNLGMGPLARYPGMDGVAQDWAEHMAEAGVLAHRPSVAPYSGEVIAAASGSLNTPQNVLQMWLDSPPHKATILNPNYDKLGVGYADGYWIMVLN